MSGHTELELPWVAINNSVDIVDVASCGLIANVWARGENRGGPKAQEKAAFIVTACNSHAALVKALEEIRGGHFDGASTLAVSGSWQLMVERLQKIADEALATLTARKVG